ncbi:MAG TPA: acyltransferase [Kofleriaceae bacterium]|jgi:peptidoglycan/LPS O-acetylase OafA/YrhL|nr:acyltransferase [Kofleriaceae bacterium]
MQNLEAQGRIPSLDGVRAFSVAYVILWHCTYQLPGPQRERLHLFLANGRLGVDIFFVISGLLITTLLVRERAKSGRIDLGGFYVRRCFRILPPAFVYLGVMVALRGTGYVEFSNSDLLAAAFFVANFRTESMSWLLLHMWSLSIEEQFYLVWPGILRKLGNRAALKAALLLVAISPLLRIGTYYLLPEYRKVMGTITFTRLDMIMTGCAMALMRGDSWYKSACERLFKLWVPGLGMLYLIFVSAFVSKKLGGTYTYVFSFTVECLIIASAIEWVIARADAPLGRFLNSRSIAHLGVISYSLYLWQQPFTDSYSTHPVMRFPLNLVLMLAAAELSRRFVELPSLALRDRLLAGKAPRVAPGQITTD